MTIRRIQSGSRRSSILYGVTFADGAGLELGTEYAAYLNTTKKLNTDIRARLGTRADNIYLHLNRSGTVAVATGRPPDVWPEDEKEPA